MTDREPAEPAEAASEAAADGAITADTQDRAREDNTTTGHDGETSACDPLGEPATQPADTYRNRIREFVARLAGSMHPPDVWGQDRPSLSALYRYAVAGPQAPPDGPLHTAGLWWYRLVALPITALAYWKAWALERPLRGIPVLVLQLAWWALNIATLITLIRLLS